MNYSLGKGIRFYTKNEVHDARNVADRIFTKVLLKEKIEEEKSELRKMNHWEMYGADVIMLIILSIAYREIEEHNLPNVQVSEVRHVLNKSPRQIKEFILSSCLIYVPYNVYTEILPILLNVLSTRKFEFKSILETAREALNDFFCF